MHAMRVAPCELLELLLQLSDLPAFSDELGGEAVQGEAESLGAKFGLGSRLVGMMVVSGHGVPWRSVLR